MQTVAGITTPIRTDLIMPETDRAPATGVPFVVLAAFCWGLSGGIAGLLMAQGWDPFVVAFCRGAVGLVFVLAWLALRPRRSGLSDRRLWMWAGLAGLGVAGNFSFYFVSIANGSVAVAVTLMYSAPVFVYLVSFALGLEVATRAKIVGIAVALLGIVLLTGIYDIDSSAITPIGIASGLLAGLSYAVFIFGFRYAAPHGSPQAILVIAFAVLVSILAWPADLDQAAAVPGSPAWPLFAALGVLGAGLSFWFYVVGMRHTRPTTASIVAMVEPMTASLFAFIVMSQGLGGLQLLGMGLILVTVTALSVRSKA